MATTKNRLNITLSKEVERALKASAKADSVPWATKASELLKLALEIEEDVYFGKLAEKRDKKGATFITHEKVWG